MDLLPKVWTAGFANRDFVAHSTRTRREREAHEAHFPSNPAHALQVVWWDRGTAGDCDRHANLARETTRTLTQHCRACAHLAGQQHLKIKNSSKTSNCKSDNQLGNHDCMPNIPRGLSTAYLANHEASASPSSLPSLPNLPNLSNAILEASTCG